MSALFGMLRGHAIEWFVYRSDDDAIVAGPFRSARDGRRWVARLGEGRPTQMDHLDVEFFTVLTDKHVYHIGTATSLLSDNRLEDPQGFANGRIWREEAGHYVTDDAQWEINKSMDGPGWQACPRSDRANAWCDSSHAPTFGTLHEAKEYVTGFYRSGAHRG